MAPIRQIRKIVSILVVLSFLVDAHVLAECARGAGVFYDELHSFSVRAPLGWCATHKGEDIVLASAASRATSIVVSYSVVETSTSGSDELEKQVLAQLAPHDRPRREHAVSTAGGARVDVWRLTGDATPHERLVAFLKQDDILIRFVLVVRPAASAQAEALFMQVIHSFRTNFGRRRRPSR